MSDIKLDANYLVIKGHFKATASSSYGVFIVFLDNTTKNVDKFDVVSSHFSTLYENNIGMPWGEMEELIARLKWKGEYATSLTHDIQASMEDIFQPGSGRAQEIWSNIKKAQLNKVNGIFEEVLARPTSDKNISVDATIETVTKQDVENGRRNRGERGSKDIISMTSPITAAPEAAQAQKVDESAVMLEVSLILSPIAGIPVYELKEGDKIMVKITEQSNRGQYFIDLLNASENNEIIPIPASVVRMSKEGKIYTVIVSIGPGVYGKSLDEDTVKVKKFDPADKKKPKEPASASLEAKTPIMDTSKVLDSANKAKGPFNFIFVIIGVIAILMLIIIVYLIF